MNLNRKKIFSFCLAMQICMALSAQDFSAARLFSSADATGSDAVLGAAYNAYGEGDYESALFLFRRALADRQNQSDSVLYMTIMAGMHSGEYKVAYADTEYFLAAYPNSEYAPLVKYQAARALFCLGDYDNSLIALGDFCHENPDNMMYASALFLIGECFYAEYDFDEAEPFYARIVGEYPNSAKASDAQYRLEAINTRKREAKLLALLKETGENYFSSKENYEKTLRRYELENSLGDARRAQDEALGHDADDADLFVFDGTNFESEENFKVRDEMSSEAKKRKADFEAELIHLKNSALEAQILLDNEGK